MASPPDRSSPRVMFRCPEPLEAWLKEQAARDDRNLSDWIRSHFETLKNKRQTTVDKGRRRG